MAAPLEISLGAARRLNIHNQLLDRHDLTPDLAGIESVARRLHCLQVDPINHVARTQLLVPWSRLGAYEPTGFDRMLWEDKTMFLYWAHAASYVLTEEYPLHTVGMRTWSEGDSPGALGMREWIKTNDRLRRHVMRRLKDGPVRARDIEDRSVVGYSSTGYYNDKGVNRMLQFLWHQGKIVVGGRLGLERIWDLPERWFPAGAPIKRIPVRSAVTKATEIALRCLGVGTRTHIKDHFIREYNAGLPEIIESLEKKKLFQRATVKTDGGVLPGVWYIHRDDIDVARSLEKDWSRRTTLLSPFDNLICDRKRSQVLFDFDFRVEIYVPPKDRRRGYYAMPILHDDQVIGTIDPRMDRKIGTFHVEGARLEERAVIPPDAAVQVAAAVQDLAAFLRAENIVTRGLPRGWKKAFA
ncbi:MAG: DNA glycosylase AlkZ-like family protein [Actinomycetota bacterium]